LLSSDPIQKRKDLTKNALKLLIRDYFFTYEKMFALNRKPKKNDFQRLSLQEESDKKKGGLKASQI